MTTLKKFFNEIKNKNIHIIGASGTESTAITLFLAQNGITSFTLHDLAEDLPHFIKSFHTSHSSLPLPLQESKLKELLKHQSQLNFKSNYLTNIEKADIVFTPQSWFMHSQNQKLKDLQNTSQKNSQHKILFSSITDLYLTLSPAKIIGITGSNGKSTTSALLHHIFQQSSQFKSYLTGNDRQTDQLLSSLHTFSPTDYLIMEISNRQLLNLPPSSIKPDISIITNILENHLSEHPSFQHYIDTKAKITLSQLPSQHFIFNNTNPHCQKIATQTKATPHPYASPDSQSTCRFSNTHLLINHTPFLELSKLPLQGTYNYQNYCAAITAALLAQIPLPKIKQGILSFTGLPNRNQKIATTTITTHLPLAPNQTTTINFYNDRQGTSIDATVQAIKSHSKPLILIFGGQNKKMDPTPLIEELTTENITAIGIQSPFTTEIQQALNNTTATTSQTKSSILNINTTHNLNSSPTPPHIPKLIITQTLTEAVQTAIKEAKKIINTAKKTPINILFSPACEYGPYFNPLSQNSDSESFNEIVKNTINSQK